MLKRIKDKSPFSASPYGQMHDRMEKNEQKRQATATRSKADEYYQWLITGVKVAQVANAVK